MHNSLELQITIFGLRCVSCYNGPLGEVPTRSQTREVQFHRILQFGLSYPARLAVGRSFHSHRLVLIHPARMYELSGMTLPDKVKERGGPARGAFARQRWRLSALPTNAKSRHGVRLISSNIHNSDMILVLLLRLQYTRLFPVPRFLLFVPQNTDC